MTIRGLVLLVLSVIVFYVTTAVVAIQAKENTDARAVTAEEVAPPKSELSEATESTDDRGAVVTKEVADPKSKFAKVGDSMVRYAGVFALAISVFLLYRGHLKPFTLYLHPAGKIAFGPNALRNDVVEDRLILNLLFKNKGARLGTVDDLALSVKGNSQTAFLIAMLAVTDRQLDMSRPLVEVSELFAGFMLGTREEAFRQLVFNTYGASAGFKFEVGTYHITIHARRSKSSLRWRDYGPFSLTIEQEDLDGITRLSEQGQVAVYSKPWDTSRSALDKLASRVGD